MALPGWLTVVFMSDQVCRLRFIPIDSSSRKIWHFVFVLELVVKINVFAELNRICVLTMLFFHNIKSNSTHVQLEEFLIWSVFQLAIPDKLPDLLSVVVLRAYFYLLLLWVCNTNWTWQLFQWDYMRNVPNVGVVGWVKKVKIIHNKFCTPITCARPGTEIRCHRCVGRFLFSSFSGFLFPY